jgi:DNA-binding MarR family transcriptional regulator
LHFTPPEIRPYHEMQISYKPARGHSECNLSKRSGLSSDFEEDLIYQVYLGVAKVPDLVTRLGIRYDTLMRTVNSLVERGLLETSTYREGLFGEYVRLHLTPNGYNLGTRLARQRQPAPAPAVSVRQQPTAQVSQPASGPPGVQQQVTVRSGWEVCGYACILLIVVLVILLVVARGWVCQTFRFIPC